MVTEGRGNVETLHKTCRLSEEYKDKFSGMLKTMEFGEGKELFMCKGLWFL